MDADLARNFVGKRIRWKRSNRWSSYIDSRHIGVAQKVVGQNILVNDEWHWLPDMSEVEVVKIDKAISNA